MESLLLPIRRCIYELPLPPGRNQQRDYQPRLKHPSQTIARQQEVKPTVQSQRAVELWKQRHRWKIAQRQPRSLLGPRGKQLSNLRILNMQMHQKRGKKPEAKAHHRPAEYGERRRNRAVVQLRIQRQQRSAKKEHQRQAQEEEYALEVSLPPVAEYHHDPEKWQKRSNRKNDEPQIEGIMQGLTRRHSIPQNLARQSPSVVFFLHHLSD